MGKDSVSVRNHGVSRLYNMTSKICGASQDKAVKANEIREGYNLL